MMRGCKLKKIFATIGIFFLVIIIVLNICFTAYIGPREIVTIYFNNLVYIFDILLLGIFIFAIANIINKFLYNNDKRKKLRMILFILFAVIYIAATIVFTLVVKPPITSDQKVVGLMAYSFNMENSEEMLEKEAYAKISIKEYMQEYNQQIPLAFIYSIFLKLIGTDDLYKLTIINVLAIIAMIFAISKIEEMISKKYTTNKVLFYTLFFTFLSIPMLVTFKYGDLSSLALSLFSIYYVMKFVETKKIRFEIIASIFSMFAYMIRMNCLIFIIATVIYLLFNLFTKIKTKRTRENIINILVIVVYLGLSIIPSKIVIAYYVNKYDLNIENKYPVSSYLLMAMEESDRANGWYNESIAEPALKNPEKARKIYPQAIKERLRYFSENIGYAFRFYTYKLASMWAENTYSAIIINLKTRNDELIKFEEPLVFFQKMLLILTCVLSIVVLIQNRKNLSPEIIYLLLIFMGGFAFHIIWEAKSRYIIPYIVVLIPLASIQIKMRKKVKTIP